MKTTTLICLAAVLLSACHHHNHRTDYRRSAPEFRKHDTYRHEYRNRLQRETNGESYRLHAPQGYLPPVGMYWNCPTEPQMLGYVTR